MLKEAVPEARAVVADVQLRFPVMAPHVEWDVVAAGLLVLSLKLQRRRATARAREA
jgi:hypothetical protein